MTAATPDEGDVQRVARAIRRANGRSEDELWLIRARAAIAALDLLWLIRARAAIAALDLPARDARVAAEALRYFADLVDSRYPKDVFPEDSLTTDGLSGRMGRLVATQARAEAAQIRADVIERGAL